MEEFIPLRMVYSPLHHIPFAVVCVSADGKHIFLDFKKHRTDTHEFLELLDFNQHFYASLGHSETPHQFFTPAHHIFVAEIFCSAAGSFGILRLKRHDQEIYEDIAFDELQDMIRRIQLLATAA